MRAIGAFRKNVWYLIGASRGGPMRARIIMNLLERPLNANQLTKKIGADYSTIRHHLEVLQKNNWITSGDEKYGVLFFPTFTDEEKEEFAAILEKVGKKLKT
ncbi:MAG: winged helix-turn-helix domain-containing protein [archaeon]|nr:winged helix-turn-helix domain-containing protein [archaeon]